MLPILTESHPISPQFPRVLTILTRLLRRESETRQETRQTRPPQRPVAGLFSGDLMCWATSCAAKLWTSAVRRVTCGSRSLRLGPSGRDAAADVGREDAGHDVSGDVEQAISCASEAGLLIGVGRQVRSLTKRADQGAQGVIAVRVQSGQEVRLGADVGDDRDRQLVVADAFDEASAPQRHCGEVGGLFVETSSFPERFDVECVSAGIDAPGCFDQQWVVAGGPDVVESIGHAPDRRPGRWAGVNHLIDGRVLEPGEPVFLGYVASVNWESTNGGAR